MTHWVGLVESVLYAAWSIFLETAPYLLFGFLVAGLVHGLVSAEAVARHLGRGKFGPVFKASVLGIPLPLCSCGVLPAALELRKKGASRGASVAFLVSTPETGVDSVAVTYALLDPLMTVFRPLAALATAVVAGVTENLLGGETEPAPLDSSAECPCSDAPPLGGTALARLREGLAFAFGDFYRDLVPWLATGMLLAGVLSSVVPDGFIRNHIGTGFLPLLVMLGAGLPLYICATASTPIAAALILKGLSPGAALVFLLAGPATNLATVTALAGTLGVAATARYLLSISVGAVGLGVLLDAAYAGLGIPPTALVGGTHEVLPPWVAWGAALLLVALALGSLLKAWEASRHGAPGACSGAA